MQDVVGQASGHDLDITVKTLEKQAADAEAGVFAGHVRATVRRKSIALSRTMLQHYLFMEAKPVPGAVVWILDDDVVLEGLSYGAGDPVDAQDVDYVSEIRKWKDSGASIVLCEVTGDPPVPALSCVRTQLVDLYHNLHRLAAISPESPFPELRDENRLARLETPDYYYDLSSSRNEPPGTALLVRADGTELDRRRGFPGDGGSPLRDSGRRSGIPAAGAK